jgi:ubiquinone/menaquinone biosynthesis C-methylase UbiE
MNKEVKKTVEAYNKYAKLYCDYTFNKLSQYQIMQFIQFLDGKKVLDAGCGSGRDVQCFIDEGIDAEGIDISKEMIKEAESRVKGTFSVMSMDKIKHKDGTFDGIWCCASLLHVPKKDVEKVVKEFSRVLKQGGVVYLSLREGETEKMIKYKKLNHEQVLFSYYTIPEIEQVLLKCGFEIITSYNEDVNTAQWINVFARKR